jgi:hypothetical protein
MFDLLAHSRLMQQHATVGKVGFGINHQFHDFNTRRKKTLDLVVCTPNKGAPPKLKKGKVSGLVVTTFADLATECEVVLTKDEAKLLASLPALHVVSVGSVCLALEAKAAMTAHIKALPRLHDELDSSHSTVHGNSGDAIAAALVMVNSGPEFISTDLNKHDLSRKPAVVSGHDQPNATIRTIEKVAELRRSSKPGEQGFDAVGIIVVNLKNDGSRCRVVTSSPAPPPADPFHYDQFIERIGSQYQAKFRGL